MLSVKNISTFYGKIQALWDVSFEVRKGRSLPWSEQTEQARQRFSIPYQA